ncbi:Ras family protein [Cardiosporidium cionae]|uniref:Ras family protein n=1 Tax=Cardiosporidium cionae TaxID=476202 RepID=A0ABQ7J5W7_9APIC|nr:Ras family protein [Cardiosporidium cionae]|eukprot:KAF8819381.1 Ras family protein [Cardiosporidium cionae]
MLGKGSSGKSALGLYHRVVRLPPEDDVSGKPISIAVEIEDTYSSLTRKEGLDISQYFNMRIIPTTLRLPGTNDSIPFSYSKIPLSSYGSTIAPRPIAPRRMGYMFVFDANEKSSFEEAINLYQLLEEYLDERQEKIRPISFLVANKIVVCDKLTFQIGEGSAPFIVADVNPNSSVFQSIITEAELFAQKKFIRLWKVSATQQERTRALFRDMIYLILAHTSLWLIDIEEESSEEEAGWCNVA